MILLILDQHGVEGVPELVPEQQVRSSLPTNTGFVNGNYSTHSFLSVLPSDAKFQLRVLSRLVTRPVAQLILEFTSLGELLVAFLDYTIGELTFTQIPLSRTLTKSQYTSMRSRRLKSYTATSALKIYFSAPRKVAPIIGQSWKTSTSKFGTFFAKE